MWLFTELEFVLDEKPVTVVDRRTALVDRDQAGDLLGQLGELFAENERLAVKAQLLEQNRGGGDEIGDLMRRFLPVLDGFERILSVGRDFPSDHAITNWLRSVEGLYFRLKTLLEKYGLFGVEAVGQPVNLDLHEVVEYRSSPDHEPETVIAVRQRGYVLHGRLLREAQVVVAAG